MIFALKKRILVLAYLACRVGLFLWLYVRMGWIYVRVAPKFLYLYLKFGLKYMKLGLMYVLLGFYKLMGAASGNSDDIKFPSMDEPLPVDIENILEISAILEIREFDLFGLAYKWWFGYQPSNKVLESHFARYMFNRIVPHWVRQYNRMVYQLHDAGKLDRATLGVADLPDATPESVRAGVRYAVILVSTLCILVLIAELTYKYLKLPCMFPPCF